MNEQTRDWMIRGIFYGIASCVMPFFCLGAELGLFIVWHPVFGTQGDLAGTLTFWVFTIVGVALGISGCFRKGWRMGLPVLGVLFNIGAVIFVYGGYGFKR